MKQSPPLRFLAAIVGGWVCVRAAMLMPEWAKEAPPVEPTAAKARGGLAGPFKLPVPDMGAELEVLAAQKPAVLSQQRPRQLSGPPARTAAEHAPVAARVAPPAATRSTEQSAFAQPRLRLAVSPSPASRWSGSAWAFLRSGDEAGLARGGTLGGSQFGARLSYRVNQDAERPLSIVARAYAPARQRAGSEAAIGLEWKPLAELPVRVLAERRQALGTEGRSAFAVMAYGGVSEVPLVAGVKLDAYAQTGAVGGRSRDLFLDGSVALELPLHRSIGIGAAVWGAAQPGVSRIDAGPRLSLKLPGVERVRVLADWRFRLHGSAAPAPGPSLTLATEF